MKLPGLPYHPRYTADEVTLGVAVALALHVLAAGPFVFKAIFPSDAREEEKPLVSRPVVQASLLKLGKPLDATKLPDRFAPQKRTAPKKETVASRDDPPTKKPDAGPPPPEHAEDSDLKNLIAKSDPFAEDSGKRRPEEGHAEGVEGGTETDPAKAQAGELYFAQLNQFFGQRLNVPSVISIGEARRLCTRLRVNIGRNMVIWHVATSPIKPSGNELLDDAARSMMLKLLDDKTPLPTPPKELDDQFRGRTVEITVLGDPSGDPSRCK